MYVDDQQRVRRMIDAAQQAQAFISEKCRSDLDSDPMLLYAMQGPNFWA